MGQILSGHLPGQSHSKMFLPVLMHIFPKPVQDWHKVASLDLLQNIWSLLQQCVP